MSVLLLYCFKGWSTYDGEADAGEEKGQKEVGLQGPYGPTERVLE